MGSTFGFCETLYVGLDQLSPNTFLRLNKQLPTMVRHWISPLFRFALETAAVAGVLMTYLNFRARQDIDRADLFFIGVLATGTSNLCNRLAACIEEWRRFRDYRRLLINFRVALENAEDYPIPYDPMHLIITSIREDSSFLRYHAQVSDLNDHLSMAQAAHQNNVTELSKLTRDAISRSLSRILEYYR